MNRLSYLFVTGVVAVLVVGGLTGYTLVGQNSINDRLAQADGQIVKLKTEAAKYQISNVEQALAAKGILDNLKKDYVKWSSVVERILATVPKDSVTRAPIIEFSSYSGTSDDRLILSAKTLDGSKSPFSDVAELIRAFETSPYFKNPFIPSISTSTSDSGLVLIFNFQVEFQNGNIEQTSNNGTNAGTKVPVSIPK